MAPRGGSRGDPVALARVASLARPVTYAHERVLPVAEPLDALLPLGLPRGAAVSVVGGPGVSAAALALVAAASASGSWVAIVGWPSVGLAAAADLGIALERLAVVDVDAQRWGAVVAALIDALDVVVARPPSTLTATTARRVAARARERGASLVLVDAGAGPVLLGAFDPVVRLVVRASTWSGLGIGHGTLTARRLVVEATARRDGRPRRVELLLPDGRGAISAVPASSAGTGAVLGTTYGSVSEPPAVAPISA